MILLQAEARPLRNGNVNPKNYPYFKEVVEGLKNHEIIQIGSAGETIYTSNVALNITYFEMINYVKRCDTFIGIDSFLQHLAWKLDKKGVVIWGPSSPIHFGHTLHKNLFNSKSFRYNQFATWEECDCITEWPSPDEVIEAVNNIIGVYSHK